MLLDISGNTFSSLGNPQDANAMAFISAAGISDTTQVTAIDNLVKDLKQNNLWNKMYAIYPFVGGTSVNNHKYNLKDPRDTDVAYRLVFSGSWTYNDGGISATTLATTNFVNTFFNPFSSSSVSQNSVHISVYLPTPLDNTTCIMGVAAATSPTVTTPALQIIRSTNHAATVNGANANDLMTIGGAAVSGHMIGNRTSSLVANTWLNGTKVTTNTTASVPPPNFNIYLGVRNQANVRAVPSDKQIRFASIGQGLTDTEATTFNTIVEAYQTSLSRQVIASTTISRPTQVTLPTVTYNPKQLYGNDLYVWVDLTDWRTMYNTVTGNTNIPSTGCVPLTGSSDTNPNHTNIRRLEDMAGTFTGSNNSRKFYAYFNASIGGPTPSTALPVSNTSSMTGTTQLFANNVLDTNKGFYSGSTYFTHTPDFTNTINFLAPNSAVTICMYMPQNVAGSTPSGQLIGLGFSYYLAGWFGFFTFGGSSPLAGLLIPTGNTSGGVQNVARVGATTAITASVANGGYFGKTIMLTGVICGSTWSIYINNELNSTGIVPPQVKYPFTTTTSAGGLGFSQNWAFSSLPGATNLTNRKIWEGFIANSYTSPQQINLLYDYFRVKFKDIQGDLN
jgi:hypothetical protein